MSFWKHSNDHVSDLTGPDLVDKDLQDQKLDEALRHFKQSVDAWSDAAYSRERALQAHAVRRRSWRLALGWALGCALVAGSLSGAVFERHHRQELARQDQMRQDQAARAAENARLSREQQAAQQARQDEEDLLARVDSDVSQAVPSAMEPLAQLMAEDGTK
jgi:hypothetical protein